jgi:peptidoglycan-associated lipoprotein
VTLQANPTTINKGESSTLSWNSTDATQLSIDPGVGAVNAQGSTKVSPTDSTTYTVTATGPGGSASATAAVSVNAPAPPPPPAAAPRDFNQEVRDASFDTDKADLRSDAREALSKTADFLKSEPSIKVTIEGHCDERGSTEYNLGLGDRRAAAVKQYLVSLGIPADRMTTVSFGKEKPFCQEHGEPCWQQNRRGHFIKAN